MGCTLCEKFRADYPLEFDEDHQPRHVLEEGMFSDPIQCAFENSNTFSTDNWCCQTMALLRKAFDLPKQALETWRIYSIWHDDGNLGVIPIPDCEERDGIQQGIVVLSWYKSRGRTGQAMVFCDNDEPELLTLKTALFIISKMKVELEGDVDGACPEFIFKP